MKTAVMVSMGAEAGQAALKAAYSPEVRAALEAELNFLPEITSEGDLYGRAISGSLSRVSYVFTCWGMKSQMESYIRQFAPKLEAIFYAGGSVQDFARPFLNVGIRLYSAYHANAIPVAQFTVAQIVLAAKGYFQAQRLYRRQRDFHEAASLSKQFTGNFGQKIGILGAGAIGKRVIQELTSRNYEVLVFDPFLSDAEAAQLSVKKRELSEIFEEAMIISNHLANNEGTKKLLDYELFKRMQAYSSFINTGRGATVVEAGLIRALEEDSSRTALLDVTWPEPAQADHPFFELENVFLSPHIAGSQSLEIQRMGEYMLDAYRSHKAGTESEHEVTLDMLKSMA